MLDLNTITLDSEAWNEIGRILAKSDERENPHVQALFGAILYVQMSPHKEVTVAESQEITFPRHVHVL